MEHEVWWFEHWAKRRWYRVEVGEDLFGQKVLVRAWGSLDNRLGGTKCECYTKKQLAAVLRRRLKRGYHLKAEAKLSTALARVKYIGLKG